MAIKKRLIRKIFGLAVFYSIVIATAVIIYIFTSSPYDTETFRIEDFKYSMETATGAEMVAQDGTTYMVVKELQSQFDASNFFYDTLYNDDVTVYVKKSDKAEDKLIPVYGVECNGIAYLQPVVRKANLWWMYSIIAMLLVLTIVIKVLQLRKVKKSQKLWEKRHYVIALYDKLGNMQLVPCSTTSYLYPNVEMMDCAFGVSHSRAQEELPETLAEAFGQCYSKLSNPSGLENQLKHEFGVRSLKEFLQYQKLLYVVWDEQDGYYLRKMKSVLPAPETNVYEIITEGTHLAKDCSKEQLVSSILKETVWS